MEKVKKNSYSEPRMRGKIRVEELLIEKQYGMLRRRSYTIDIIKMKTTAAAATTRRKNENNFMFTIELSVPVAVHSMAIYEWEHSLPVKIVISISYTQVIIPHAYFAFSLLFRFVSFALFVLCIFIYHWICFWRICTYKQTVNIQRLKRSPFLRANLWFCCSGRRFFYIPHSSTSYYHAGIWCVFVCVRSKF